MTGPEGGLSFWPLLAGFAFAIGTLVAIAVAAAAVGVLIFGPRKIDSLIIPAMATFGVAVIVLFSGWWTTMAQAPFVLALLAAVGVSLSAMQRFVGDRLHEGSAEWPWFVLAGGIVAGACVAGFLGFAASFGREPQLAGAAALVGAMIGAVVAWRGGILPAGPNSVGIVDADDTTLEPRDELTPNADDADRG
jgi:hypothetical protein